MAAGKTESFDSMPLARAQELINLAATIEEKERLEKSGSLHWFHWAIILASLVLTIGAWSFTKSQHETQVRERFDREANQVVELVRDRMRQYETVLSSGAAAIESTQVHADHKAWRKYALSLDVQSKYPGINGIGFIDHLPRSELQNYLDDQREQRPDFRIFPTHIQDELFPIAFIEPVESNAAAIGLDIAHETNRYDAAKKARDTGEPQITGPITLVQDSKKTPGFLFYSPVYMETEASGEERNHESFIGMVYAAFVVETLMQGTLQNDKRQVGFQISDSATSLFNENQKGYEGFDPSPMFASKKNVNVYGRDWTFDIWSKQSFNIAAATNKPRMILIGGLCIDALLLAMFALLARANRRALTFAGRMAAAQHDDATRLENIIDNTVDGMMTSGPDMRVNSFNKACEDIFGYNAQDVLGEKVQMLFPHMNPKLFAKFSTSGLVKELEVTGRREDRSHVPLEISASAIMMAGQPLYNITIRDISLRKAADAKLKKAMDDLIFSNEELEKFAYIASHDLKSPLRSIDNLSKWLEEDLDKVLDDENRGRIATLRQRVTRMESLLDDLLAYSRAGYGAAESKREKASTLVKNVWDVLYVPDHFKLKIDNALNDFDVAQMPLQQVIHNLINNALKHHDKPKGLITVSCIERGEFYEFSIADDGPGIAPEFHEKIFQMFQTLKPRDDVEGSGMGLALVKKIIYCYGGEIDVSSIAGEGATFTFTWPKTLPDRSESGQPMRAKAA